MLNLELKGIFFLTHRAKQLCLRWDGQHSHYATLAIGPAEPTCSVLDSSTAAPQDLDQSMTQYPHHPQHPQETTPTATSPQAVAGDPGGCDGAEVVVHTAGGEDETMVSIAALTPLWRRAGRPSQPQEQTSE